jgi:hypothetical protein
MVKNEIIFNNQDGLVINYKEKGLIVQHLKINLIKDREFVGKSRFLLFEIKDKSRSFNILLLKEEVKKIILDLKEVMSVSTIHKEYEHCSIIKTKNNAPQDFLSFGLAEENQKISILIYDVPDNASSKIFILRKETEQVVKTLNYFEKNMVSIV